MSSDYDPTEFIDGDFQRQKPSYTAVQPGQLQRAPTRDEVDSKVVEAQQKLAELKRAQEELERERAALEETRRRQMEFQTGRQEMLQHLARGVSLLHDAEFNARREAEAMTKALAGLREAQNRLEVINEESWKKESFDVELTRALTAVENARMEWNTARLKFPVLTPSPATVAPATPAEGPAPIIPTGLSFGQACRLGFALTWPLTAVALLILAVLLAIMFR